MAALAVGLYFWSARQPVPFLFSRQPISYYELLTAGFRSGHLSVKLEPHPALLALPNPYDPVANAPYRVHDMTFYHGKYYLYFGVTPVLVFFWPIAAFIGWYPTEPCAVAAFGCLGIAAGLALLCAIRRRYFPAAPLWALALGCLCLAFASPVLTLTAAANFYQVPIACAFALNLLTLGAIYRALHSPRRAVAWLAAASLLFGLAVGARPNYLLGGFVLFLPCAWLVRQAGGSLREARSPGERKTRNQFLLATFGPAAICGLGLALYNYERFGSFTEFGMRYQLAGESFLNLQPLSLGHLVPNGFDYLFGAGAWHRYFPFFEPPAAKPYGMLSYVPWTWFGVVAFLSLAAAGGEEEGRWRVLLRTMAAGLAANFFLLSCFFGTTDRYLSDFVPAGLLLGGIGVLAITAWAARRPWRFGLAAPILLAAAASIFVELAAFSVRTPRDDVVLALGRIANRPIFRREQAHGVQFGPLRLDLELPADRATGAEPLLETGVNPDSRDWIELRYLNADRAKLALFHAGVGYLEGAPFAVPASRRISVEVSASSLWPPFSHPVFAGWTSEQYREASRDLRLSVDGVETLRAAFACYPSSPEDLRIGRLAWPGQGVADDFLGQGAGRDPPAAGRAARAASGSPFPDSRRPAALFPRRPHLGLRAARPDGHGRAARPALVHLRGRGQPALQFQSFRLWRPRSEPVAFDPLRPHRLIVWMGSLAPGGPDAASATVLPLSRRITVLLDGELAFDEEALFYPAAPETLLFGSNPLGASTELTRFTGRILAADSLPDLSVLPASTRTGETGAVDLQVMFPDGMSGSTEPLVTTGMSGAGDILYVHYLDPTHVSFGFHHWGISTLNGAPVEIDLHQPHRLEITLDSLYPPGGASRPFSGRLRVLRDGAAVLEGSADCFPSAPYEIRIGANALGGSVSDPAFTGRLISVERRQPDQLPSAALWTGWGAVAMDTLLPTGLAGAAEPLVQTGVAGAADTLFVRYGDDRHVVFGLDHWGTAAAQSEPVEVDYSVPHRLEFSLDALQPPGAPASRRVRVSLDGAEVWQADAANYPSRADQVRIAINPLGASSCRASYTGQILTLARPARVP